MFREWKKGKSFTKAQNGFVKGAGGASGISTNYIWFGWFWLNVFVLVCSCDIWLWK